jgi:hypothetical protein
MVDDNNRVAPDPARPESAASAAGADPVNGVPPGSAAEGIPPTREPLAPPAPAPAERIAPGPPPVAAIGDQVRAGEPPAAAAATGATAEKGKETPPEPKDGFREIVETVVFVVVLVLLLKAFLAEAFVIPTGSMAPTLLGYHRNVTCPQCGHTFPVNLSNELDPESRMNVRVTGCTCPNCFLPFNFLPKGQ